jgi:hypothetical protein
VEKAKVNAFPNELTIPSCNPLIVNAPSCNRPGEGGRVRNLKTADGQSIVERMEAFDEQGRSYSYSFVEAPFPAKDYLATLSVQEIAGNATSVVQWSGSFTPVGVGDDEVTDLFHGIYVEGLAALKQSLAAMQSVD